MIPQIVRPLCRNVIKAGVSRANLITRQGHDVAKKEHKALMDLSPVPQGSWEADYKARNARHNMQLVAGILFFAATYGFAYANDFLFINATVPPLPGQEK